MSPVGECTKLVLRARPHGRIGTTLEMILFLALFAATLALCAAADQPLAREPRDGPVRLSSGLVVRFDEASSPWSLKSFLERMAMSLHAKGLAD